MLKVVGFVTPVQLRRAVHTHCRRVHSIALLRDTRAVLAAHASVLILLMNDA
jgi:hypothetical protein